MTYQATLVAQLDLLMVGIKQQNPEVFSIARACMETVAALAYVSDKVEKEYNNKEFDKAWEILYRAIMGQRTFPFSTKEEITLRPKSFNILDYVDKADKLLTKELKKLPNHKSGDKPFKFQYETLSELTHPNYMALSLYWEAREDKFVYENPPRCLREEDLGLLLHHITPALFIYLMFLKRAIKFEKSLLKIS